MTVTNDELVAKLRDKENRTEEDIELAASRIEKQNVFLRHNMFAEKHFGVFFICGYAGEMDSNGMPEQVHICPAYGSDVTYRYMRGTSHAPEW